MGKGGQRKGAGRKAKKDRQDKQLVGSPEVWKALEAYRKRHGLASASAAFRHLVECHGGK